MATSNSGHSPAPAATIDSHAAAAAAAAAAAVNNWTCEHFDIWTYMKYRTIRKIEELNIWTDICSCILIVIIP